MRISDWSSDVCSSDLLGARLLLALRHGRYGLVIAVLPHLDDMRGHLEQRNWLPISLAWPRAKQDRVEGGERVRLHQIFQMLHLGKRLAQVHAVSSSQLVILANLVISLGDGPVIFGLSLIFLAHSIDVSKIGRESCRERGGYE